MPEVLQRKSNTRCWKITFTGSIQVLQTGDSILRSSEIGNDLGCDGQLVKYELLEWGKRVNEMPGH